ncbi:FAD-dependent oxidoreductase [Fulvivirgaceae bacterium PWU5]|uniref:FAD-dependent oxidoreductase n=1 Tax=Dawidia cretensis TaxID=2782350 RepID=A0AAP2GTK2_9BACT|nr:FAD-dependent oxidoreductase [Dawidia cretensis]MBT1707550.1 FAD-dependent oxidoreductase [Dawidia cretensis]
MIARDGSFVSLWQEMPVYGSLHRAQQDTSYDVAIVGGGITGITTALLLQQAGKRCILVEAENLGFGTTGGTTAHLNTLLDTPYTTIIQNFGTSGAQSVARAAREAVDLIQRHVSTYGIDCGFEEAAAYLFSQDEKQSKELQDIFDASRTVGLAIQYTDSIPLPIPMQKAVRVERQGKFHPLRYVHALAHAFEALGGAILQYAPVTKVTEGDVVLIDAGGKSIRAHNLVYATHTPPGINLLHLRLAPWRSYAMAVTLADGKYPEGLCYDMYDPYHYYRTQVVDGKSYLIAGGEDHKTGHEENTEKRFRTLEAHVRKYFAVESIAYQWSSQYFEPVDGLPYIGNLPMHGNNIYVATGYGGNGMTYSTVAAGILRDLITKQENVYQELFSPSRIKPVAGFTSFMQNNLDVAKNLIGGWFSSEALQDLANLAPGEGKVVEYEGKSIALSRDSEGALHAVSPTCTHMGCHVAWNLAEQSWDCPCHGARYSPDGKVLTGPASADLEVVSLRSAVESNS